jgi:peptidoglycan/LPS O-acetylase OafA/YrhL
MKAELLGWRPGLEGLRGVAVLLVMLFHFGATRETFPGGSLGVDLFFVLSGFLITTLLLEERSRDGSISLGAFYQRRGRRLLPALVVFLAFFATITLVTRQPGSGNLLPTVITSQLYIFNFLDDLGGAGTQGAGHLWSLSVEEQFYLLWPVLVIVTLRFRPQALLWLSLVVFAISASLPFWSGRGYGELYSGTDFRAQELMAGAILAQLRFSGLITASIVKYMAFRALLLLAVLFFALFIHRMHDRVDFLNEGLYTATAVFGAVIVCAALYAPPRLLTNRVICYVGTRSYALYLWHHAIAFWMRDVGGVLELGLSLTLSFVAAELSWRLVEDRGSYLFRMLRWVRNGLPRSGTEPAQRRSRIAATAQPSD